MRLYKTVRLLDLAKALAGSAEGLTLDEIADLQKVDRRTAERMRDALRLIFPPLEEIADGRTRAIGCQNGLSDRITIVPESD